MDILQREGKYPVPSQAPSTMGVEFSGTIEKLGRNPEIGFKLGDEVFGLAYGGGFKPGDSVLWHAGASSVSIAGIQLAKNDGASAVFVTVGSQEKIDFCLDKLGVTAGYNYKTQDWASELLEATDNCGVDLIIDFVGATHFQGNLNVAARDARIVQLGQMSGSILPAGVDISSLLRKRVRLEGSTLRSRGEGYQKKLRDLLVKHALPKFRDGTFTVFIEKVLPFEHVADAHILLESNCTKGKVICTVD
ncbi:hypothetical protein APSETT444_004567 [Aspergillus pseudonomiae]